MDVTFEALLESFHLSDCLKNCKILSKKELSPQRRLYGNRAQETSTTVTKTERWLQKRGKIRVWGKLTDVCTTAQLTTKTRMLSQIRMILNGALLTRDSHDCHHKAYIETILNYSTQDGDTVLAPQGWVNGALDCPFQLATARADRDHPTANEQAEFKGYNQLTL